MNIKSLSDKQLHQNLLTLKSKESRIVASIISHLEEVYRRRLFAAYKCSSIYDYCIRILGYSNGEAHKKISACKLASQCEGVKESIALGELSLSNAASVQVFLNKSIKLQGSCDNASHEKVNQDPADEGLTQKCLDADLSSQNKTVATLGNTATFNRSTKTCHSNGSLSPKAIIDRVKNKTTKECEAELQRIASENGLKLPEIKPIKRRFGEKTMLKVLLDHEKLQLLKSRLNVSCEQELLQLLIEEKLKSTEPRTEVPAKKRQKPSLKARNISPSKRAIVVKRANGQCENCGSKFNLQVDHKMSVALGGGNDINNLRLLCRSCNQRAAIEQLGLQKIDPYINNKSTPREGQLALKFVS